MKKIILACIVSFVLGYLVHKFTYQKKINISQTENNNQLVKINEEEFESTIKKLFKFLNIMKNEMDNLSDQKK